MNLPDPGTFVIVANEKHGDLYYGTSSHEDIIKAFKSILETRLADGYYDPDAPLKGEMLSEEEIQKLPERLREQERERNKRIAMCHFSWMKGVRFFFSVRRYLGSDWSSDPVKGCIEGWRLLEARSGAEYEKVSLEPFSDPEAGDGDSLKDRIKAVLKETDRAAKSYEKSYEKVLSGLKKSTGQK